MKTTRLLVHTALAAAFTLTAVAQQGDALKLVTVFSSVRIFGGDRHAAREHPLLTATE